MPTLSTASGSFSAAMKTYYLGPLNQQVHKAKVLLERLQKNSENISGNFAYIPLITGRNVGIGSRADTSGSGPTLPQSGTQTYSAATFQMTYHYGRGRISGPVMRASKTSSGAFAKALDLEMQGLMESLPEDLNRQIVSYGHGRAATIQANGSTAQVDVFATSNFNLRVGDRVHIAHIADGLGWLPTAGTTVSTITRDNAAGVHRLLLAASPGAAFTTGTDALYFGATPDSGVLAVVDSSRANDCYGIQAAVSGSTGNVGAEENTVAVAAEFLTGSLNYGGINRSTSPFWQAQWLRNPATAGTNRPMTNAVLQQAWLTAVNIGGASPKNLEIYTNPGLWATLGLLHVGDRRYNDYKNTLEGGWEYLDYNGVKVLYDRDLPRDIMWFLDMTSLMLLTSSDYEFMDEDGTIMNRVPNVDAWEFVLYKDIQLGCKNCSKNLKLDDLVSVANIEG